MKGEIYPCILAYTKEEFLEKLRLVEGGIAKWIQVDFMDGRFCGKQTICPTDLSDLIIKCNLEAHIMAYQPERYFEDLRILGFKRVLIHREVYLTAQDCKKAINNARRCFKEVGLAVNPDTPLEDYRDFGLNSVQLMAVYPGKSGQILLEGIYDRIKEVKKTNPSFVIAVDGGVKEDNINELQKAGASRFIMASAIFAGQKVNRNYKNLIQLIMTKYP